MKKIKIKKAKHYQVCVMGHTPDKEQVTEKICLWASSVDEAHNKAERKSSLDGATTIGSLQICPVFLRSTIQ